MDKLTEARAVLAPNRRVSSDTTMTDSLTLEPPIAQRRRHRSAYPCNLTLHTHPTREAKRVRCNEGLGDAPQVAVDFGGGLVRRELVRGQGKSRFGKRRKLEGPALSQ